MTPASLAIQLPAGALHANQPERDEVQEAAAPMACQKPSVDLAYAHARKRHEQAQGLHIMY